MNQGVEVHWFRFSEKFMAFGIGASSDKYVLGVSNC